MDEYADDVIEAELIELGIEAQSECEIGDDHDVMPFCGIQMQYVIDRFNRMTKFILGCGSSEVFRMK